MSRTASSRWKSVLPLADMCVPVLVSPALVPKPWKEVERPDWIVLGVRLHCSSRYRSRSSRTSSSSSASGRQRSPPLTSSILPSGFHFFDAPQTTSCFKTPRSDADAHRISTSISSHGKHAQSKLGFSRGTKEVGQAPAQRLA